GQFGFVRRNAKTNRGASKPNQHPPHHRTQKHPHLRPLPHPPHPHHPLARTRHHQKPPLRPQHHHHLHPRLETKLPHHPPLKQLTHLSKTFLALTGKNVPKR